MAGTPVITAEVTCRYEPTCIHGAVRHFSLHVADTVGATHELPRLTDRILVCDSTILLAKKILGLISYVASYHLDIIGVAYTVYSHWDQSPGSNGATGIHIETLAVDAAVACEFGIQLVAAFDHFHFHIEAILVKTGTRSPETTG